MDDDTGFARLEGARALSWRWLGVLVVCLILRGAGTISCELNMSDWFLFLRRLVLVLFFILYAQLLEVKGAVLAASDLVAAGSLHEG